MVAALIIAGAVALVAAAFLALMILASEYQH
jgi:hypothetical protein